MRRRMRAAALQNKNAALNSAAGSQRWCRDRGHCRSQPCSYARTVVLPAKVDQAQSQAKFESGVLTLTLAKKVPAGAKQPSNA